MTWYRIGIFTKYNVVDFIFNLQPQKLSLQGFEKFDNELEFSKFIASEIVKFKFQRKVFSCKMELDNITLPVREEKFSPLKVTIQVQQSTVIT